jgi:catechol 2,3-dioxygenase-like lactoylglutathione lyase family enzyme
MISKALATPTLPVVDLKRARSFYEGKLGFKVIQEDPSPGLRLRCGDCTTLYLYQRSATKADHTVVSFDVDDIEAEVNELKKKGIKFEEYDLPDMGIKTVNGIASMNGDKAAWFRDTEGNILALGQWSKK